MASPRKQTNQATPTPTAPLFELTRVTMDDMQRHAERAFEQGAAQLNEGLRLQRAFAQQAMTMTRSWLDGLEESSRRVPDFGALFSLPTMPRSAA